MSGTPALLARSSAIASMSVMTPPGLAIDSMKIALVFGVIARLEGADVVGVGPHHVPAEVLEGVVELVDRAAIELLARRRTRRPAASGSASPAPARRGRRRPRARRCRLRARRRAPPARRWSGCRCAYRCCRRSAGRTARRRGRRPRTRTRWSDRSASRARRWSGRAGRRHGSRAWQSLGCGRSCPVLVLPGPDGPRIRTVVYRSACTPSRWGTPAPPTALSTVRGPAPQSLRLARRVAPSHARGATATASRAGRAPSCWRSSAASSRLIRRATLQP